MIVFPEEHGDSFFVEKGESFVNHPGYKVFGVVCEFVVMFFFGPERVMEIEVSCDNDFCVV